RPGSPRRCRPGARRAGGPARGATSCPHLRFGEAEGGDRDRALGEQDALRPGEIEGRSVGVHGEEEAIARDPMETGYLRDRVPEPGELGEAQEGEDGAEGGEEHGALE